MDVSVRTVRQVANGLASWAAVAALLYLVLAAAPTLDPLWTGLTLLIVVVGVAPSIAHRSWKRMPVWPLLVLAATPLLIRAFGPAAVIDALAVLAVTVANTLPSAPVVEPRALARVVFVVFAYSEAIALGMLSLLAVANVQRFSSLHLTDRFASLVIVVTTVGLSGVWAVSRWVADFYLGTGFLASNSALMAEFSATTAAAIVVGGVGGPLFCRARGQKRQRDPAPTMFELRPRLIHRLDDVLIILFQTAILGILVFGVLEDRPTIIFNGVFALLVTQVAAVFERGSRRPVYRTLVLWVSTAALFHAVGTLGPYGDFWWWDDVAHALSASAVAAIGYTGARAFDVEDECLRLPASFLFVYVLLFVVTAGVIWELFEFALTGVAVVLDISPPLAQKGLDDTVMDLVFDTAGALVVAIGSLYPRVGVDTTATAEPT